MPAAKEVIHIHIGQAGCHVGESVWELYCQEHGIQHDGKRMGGVDEADDEEEDESFGSFFSETSAGQFVPRALFVDTDPSTAEGLMKTKQKDLWKKANVVCSLKGDCHSNFFAGLDIARQCKFNDEVMDRVRIAADQCMNLQGFFVIHSFGGGTGTGVGSEVLREIDEQYRKKLIFQPVIYPSNQFSSSLVEPYNCIFAMHATADLVDLSMVLDNQGAWGMCSRNLGIKNPKFKDVNRLIAQVLSSATTSLRFESELCASLQEVLTNLVPTKQYRYPILSLAPVRPADGSSHERHSTADIINDLFDRTNHLVDCVDPPMLSGNRYLAAVVLLRGMDNALDKDQACREICKTSTARELEQALKSMPEGGGFRAIQVTEAMGALRSLRDESCGHRKPVRFVPWLKGGGFKVAVCKYPPIVPMDSRTGRPFMAKTSRQGACLANCTAVRQIFVRQFAKYLKLLYRKAYVWQFLSEAADQEIFEEAAETVRNIIQDYETLLKQCVDMECEEGRNHKLTGDTSRSGAR